MRILGRLSSAQLKQLREGIDLEEGVAKFDSIAVEGGSGANAWYRVSLHGGRYREIRRLFAALDIPVNRLLRTDYGPVALGDMHRGMTRQLTEPELGALYGAVGLELE